MKKAQVCNHPNLEVNHGAGEERQRAGGRRQLCKRFLQISADLKVQVLDLPPASCLRPPAFSPRISMMFNDHHLPKSPLL
jgi:hypothetical protein